MATRANSSVRQRDGYQKDITGGDDVNDEDKKNLRLALLWNATESTEVIARLGYEDMDQLSGVLHTTNRAAWEAANPGRQYDTFGHGAWDAPKQQEKRELLSASLEVNQEIGGATRGIRIDQCDVALGEGLSRCVAGKQRQGHGHTSATLHAFLPERSLGLLANATSGDARGRDLLACSHASIEQSAVSPGIPFACPTSASTSCCRPHWWAAIRNPTG